MADPYSAKPWLKFYDEHVPPNLAYPEKTYLAYFREAVESVPRKVAVYYMGRGITFHELDRLSDKFARFLQHAGLRPGDRVGVHLPNLPAYYISIIGIQKAGCVLSGVSPLLQPKELEYQLNDSGAKCLFTLDILYEKIAAVWEKTGVKTVVVTQIADFLSPVKKFLGTLLKKIPTASITRPPAKNVHRFRQILKDMPTDKIEVKRSLKDPMLMQYTGGTTGLPLYGMKKAGSVGIPFPDTEVKLVHPDTGEPAAPGEPGEFVARGPQVFTLGYHNNPEETARTLKEGWIYTGDICKMDADGYFYVVDRLKDMVNVSGFNVFTRQVDEVLMEHPDIDMAATIGLPDPKRPGSEIVASAVVLRSGIEKSTRMKDNITQFLRAKVAPYKIPRLIEFVDELPISPVGKVLKRELRKEIQAE